MKKLNLGCGGDYKPGWINLDNDKNVKADVYHDLEKLPYPFKSNEIEETFIKHLFEHLSSPLEFLEELWRISKNKASIVIIVPHFSSRGAWGDLTHKRAFSSKAFEIREYYFKKAKFSIDKIRFRINSMRFLEPLLNINPLITDSFLCKFLPVSEIEVHLRIKK